MPNQAIKYARFARRTSFYSVAYDVRKLARPQNSPRPAPQSQLLRSRIMESRPCSTVIVTGVSTEKPAFSSQRPFRRMNGATRFPLEGCVSGYSPSGLYEL